MIQFARLVPVWYVTHLVESRDLFELLGFEVESGSSTHAVMVLHAVGAIHLKQHQRHPNAHVDDDSPAALIAPQSIILECLGKQGIDSYRQTLCGTMNCDVSEIARLGWGKKQFRVTTNDGHRIVFVQERIVFQG